MIERVVASSFMHTTTEPSEETQTERQRSLADDTTTLRSLPNVYGGALAGDDIDDDVDDDDVDVVESLRVH